MSFLIPPDFRKQIQSDNLNQVIGSDTTILASAILTAIEEANSYLVQKYDTSLEFQDTSIYDPTVAYLAASRVYLDAPVYDATQPYSLYYLTLSGGNVYLCNTAITTPEAFNPAHWSYLGTQYTIFYVGYPFTPFSLKNVYAVNDKVFWKNAVYTCQIATVVLCHNTLIQYNQYQNIPYQNIFPDDPLNGLQYWGAGAAFSVPAGTLYSYPAGNYAPPYPQTFQNQFTSGTAGQTVVVITALIGMSVIQIIKEIKPLLNSQYTFDKNTGTITLIGTSLAVGESLFTLYTAFVVNPGSSSWIMGDNRTQQLITYLVDITLYHVHSRIAPRNIPELRVKRYDDSIRWLKMAAKGDITANIPLLTPPQGARIRYGGSVKNINSY